MIDPFEKQAQITGEMFTPTEITAPEKRHSTLLVFYIGIGFNSEDRMTRLAASVNLEDTIKADIITIGDEGKIYKGLFMGVKDSVEPESFEQDWLSFYRLVIKAETPQGF